LQVTDNYTALNMRAGVRINGGEDIRVRENTILHNLADGKTRQSEVLLDLHDAAGPDRVEIAFNRIDARRNAAVTECPEATGTRVTDNVYDSADPKGIVLQSKDAVAERNLRLRLSRWYGPDDPLAQTGTYWLADQRPGDVSQ
jgi:hypothetical protein